MSDQQIACSECGATFVFTAAEQAFYAEKQLAAPPKRCKPCRQARKSAREGGQGAGGGGAGVNRRFSGGGNEHRAPSGGSDFRGAPRGRPAPGGGGRDARLSGNFRAANGPPNGGPPHGGQGYGGQGHGGQGYGASNNGYGAPSGRGGPPPRDGYNKPRGGSDFRGPSFPSDARGGGSQHARFDAPGAPPPEARPAPPHVKGPQQRVRPERPKFDITCAECGTQSQVPFKPLEGRQVFCQPCYRARRGSMENATEGVAVADTDSGIVE